MALIGLYGALAASASVFIGIMAALLATELSNRRAERARIRGRIKEIRAIRSGLIDQKESYVKRIGRIEDNQVEREEYQEASDDVLKFIYDHVGLSYSPHPNSLTIDDAMEEMANFLEIDESDLNEYHRQVIEDEWGLLEDELKGGVQSKITADSSITAANKQIAGQRELSIEERLQRYRTSLTNTKNRIDSLEREWKGHHEEFESQDPAQLIKDIWVAFGAILLSVFAPIIAYWLRDIGFTVSIGSPAWESGIVVLLWAAGLAGVLIYLQYKIHQNEEQPPEPPSASLE